MGAPSKTNHHRHHRPRQRQRFSCAQSGNTISCASSVLPLPRACLPCCLPPAAAEMAACCSPADAFPRKTDPPPPHLCIIILAAFDVASRDLYYFSSVHVINVRSGVYQNEKKKLFLESCGAENLYMLLCTTVHVYSECEVHFDFAHLD